jgi:formate hydrogenlyase subunit 6/NADH:ubiquinone oxidoreductase subunit I
MVSEGYRGMITLLRDKCTSCMMCARACPANAIKIQVVDEKKLPGLDYARCVFCGFCVDVCPVKAISHTTLHDVAYLKYEENLFPPEKLVDGGRDPYHVPKGVVVVEIHEKKGLVYKKPRLKEEIEPKGQEIIKLAEEVEPRPKEERSEGAKTKPPQEAGKETPETAPREVAGAEPEKRDRNPPEERTATEFKGEAGLGEGTQT